MFQPHRAIFRQHKSTQDTHNQRSRTPNGAQSSCNTKDKKIKHPVTPKLIIIIIIIIIIITMTYFKSTIWQNAQCSGFLKNVLPEDDRVVETCSA
jgi:hypothetical protein